MTDKKITALTVGVPISTDVIPYVSDPDGTPVTKKTLVSSLGGGGGGGPNGHMVNGKISVTVASNNITVALKTLADTDPSSSDKVTVRINSVNYDITAALSVTVNAGTNTFNSGAAEFAAKLVGYFAYLSYRTASSAVVIGFSRIPYATLYSDFSGTATAETYAAFSTAPASTDSVTNIGYFEATLSAGAGYTWTVPTFTSANLRQRPTFETRLLTWLPAWTNLTVGNGTYSATYKIKNTNIDFNIDLIWGSTTSISGAVSHSTPMAGVGFGNAKVTGTLGIKDTGTAQFSGVNLMQSASLINYRVLTVSGTYATQDQISSTIPMTWTTTDEFHEWGTYEMV